LLIFFYVVVVLFVLSVLPDHSLVKYQSQNIAAYIKFTIGRLKMKKAVSYQKQKWQGKIGKFRLLVMNLYIGLTHPASRSQHQQ